LGRQDPKQRAPGRHPCEWPLQHADEQAALLKLPHDERGELRVGLEVGAEQDAARFGPLDPQKVLKEVRRNAQDGDRVTYKWQRRGQALERFRISRHRQVTCPSPRGHSQVGQVCCQPFLQLARPAGSHQRRPRWPTADVDQEAGAIRLRSSAGECGRGGSRSACRTDGGHEDDPPVHRPVGLAKLSLVTTR
jgi:hypothetical protein